jgi:hypothetical protein
MTTTDVPTTTRAPQMTRDLDMHDRRHLGLANDNLELRPSHRRVALRVSCRQKDLESERVLP